MSCWSCTSPHWQWRADTKFNRTYKLFLHVVCERIYYANIWFRSGLHFKHILLHFWYHHSNREGFPLVFLSSAVLLLVTTVQTRFFFKKNMERSRRFPASICVYVFSNCSWFNFKVSHSIFKVRRTHKYRYSKPFTQTNVTHEDICVFFLLLPSTTFKHIQMTLNNFNPEYSIAVLKLNIYHRLDSEGGVYVSFCAFIV